MIDDPVPWLQELEARGVTAAIYEGISGVNFPTNLDDTGLITLTPEKDLMSLYPQRK